MTSRRSSTTHLRSPATPQPASSCSSLAKQNIGYTYVGTWYDVLPPYFGRFLTDSSNGEC